MAEKPKTSDSTQDDASGELLPEPVFEDPSLVAVTNGGRTIRIHHTALHEHRRLGWTPVKSSD
jgi:hypothetical protein